MTFEFDGIDDNPFDYRAEYDLASDGDGYVVTDLDFSDAPPFWFADRLAVEDTEHFYGLAVESSTDLGELMIEAEDAYAAIAETPLPLVEKSLIYLTDHPGGFPGPHRARLTHARSCGVVLPDRGHGVQRREPDRVHQRWSVRRERRQCGPSGDDPPRVGPPPSGRDGAAIHPGVGERRDRDLLRLPVDSRDTFCARSRPCVPGDLARHVDVGGATG